MDPSPRIAVHGAAGRMGRAVIRALIEQGRGAELCAALVLEQEPLRDAPLASVFGGAAPRLSFRAALDTGVLPSVLVDFSGAAGFDAALALAERAGCGLVSGSTGLGEAQLRALESAATRIPVLWASNFSLGVALLRRLAAEAARVLGPDFDVEVLETHHRLKVDAPSGTALTLGRAVAEARGQRFDAVARYARHGIGAVRAPGEIGFAVLRAADVVGEHTVLFAAEGERVELSHRATSRDIFARGALAAARWLAHRAPGRYELADVLG